MLTRFLSYYVSVVDVTPQLDSCFRDSPGRPNRGCVSCLHVGCPSSPDLPTLHLSSPRIRCPVVERDVWNWNDVGVSVEHQGLAATGTFQDVNYIRPVSFDLPEVNFVVQSPGGHLVTEPRLAG